MKKKDLPEITLSKETIRLLQSPEELRQVPGGFSIIYTFSGCAPCFC